MLRNAEGLVRLGMLALPLAGLLALVGLYSTVKLGSGGILATGDNRAIVSAGYFVSVLLGSVLALTVLIFGVVALHAYLANGGQRTLVLGAMVSSIVGIALMLSRLGVFAYAVPALSRSFLDGNPESIRIVDSIFAGPLETVDSVSILLYSAGFVLFGIAIWRSSVLPGWTGILVAVHAPLVSGPFPLVGSVAGALLALVGGGWIAFSVLRDPPGQRESLTTPRAGRANSREI
jgi:hypothetical protein